MELHSIEAEQAVIGCLLSDNDSWWKAQGQISSGEFFRADHREFFATITRMIEDGKPADVLTVSDVLGRGHVRALGEIAHSFPTAANIATYAAIVREKAQRRSLAKALQEAQEQVATAPIGPLLSGTAEALEAISHSEMGTYRDFNEIIRAGLKAVQFAEERAKAGGIVGVPFGIPAIDRRTGGLYGPRLWCVAGRPGLGKTALTLQAAVHAATKGHKGGILSLEMSDEELGLRTLANRLQVNLTALTQADKRTLEIAHQRMGKANIRDLPIWTDTATMTLDGIVARITEWRRKYGIEFAIVDHIGLIELHEYGNRNDDLGKVSRTLKKLCKRLDMPIVLVSQLNRSLEKDGRLPKLSDLRDSGNIEQDIDVGLFIAGEEDEISLGLLKNRLGRKGWMPEKFSFEGATQTFKESYGVAA